MSRPKYKSRIWISRTGYWWVDGKYWSEKIPEKFNSCCSHRNFRTLKRAAKAFDALDSDVRLTIGYRKRGEIYIKWEAEK